MTDDRVTINSQEVKDLKPRIVQMTQILREIDNKREELKEAAELIEEEFKLKKKVVVKLARTMYKNNYATLQAENEHFEFLYEVLSGSTNKPAAGETE